MINALKKRTADTWHYWSQKRNESGNPQRLSSKNTYILPSTFGWAYGFFLLTLFSGAINYQISTIFLMTFLLAIIGLVSAWEAHANLNDLSIKLVSVNDCQQGQAAQLVLVFNAHQKKRFSIQCHVGKNTGVFLDAMTQPDSMLMIPIETPIRGYFSLPRITLSSVYPFGIFQVWGYVDFTEKYYVYPQPINPDFWPSCVSKGDVNIQNALGNDDVYELKQVENPWSQPNLIAWKIAAKGQGWYLKTLHSNYSDYWLFKLDDLSGISIEKQLGYLSYWLKEAEINNYLYALELCGTKTAFSNGEIHLQTCLRLLALY